ncbi:MAG: cobalamin-dependent protein [Deltaproteobacteria bacterium]|nr:cobalamin-dependent protein [Deltaproteobacteria bacterium]
MKTVLIINSPLFRECKPLYDEESLPPIGLGYIATALRNKGDNIDLIDAVAKNIPLSELVATVEEKAPDFVTINIFTTNFNLVKEFIAYNNQGWCPRNFVNKKQGYNLDHGIMPVRFFG